MNPVPKLEEEEEEEEELFEMMPTYFKLSNHFSNLLFKDLTIHNTEELIYACFVIGMVTFILEGAHILFLYWETRVRQHPLTYGQTDSQFNDTAVLFSSLLIPSSIHSIRKRRLKYHCLAFLAHTTNVVFAYFIMLAVMSYNGWIAISVLCGSGLGYFLFGSLKYKIHLKYTTTSPLRPSHSSNSLQINTIEETPEIDFPML